MSAGRSLQNNDFPTCYTQNFSGVTLRASDRQTHREPNSLMRMPNAKREANSILQDHTETNNKKVMIPDSDFFRPAGGHCNPASNSPCRTCSSRPSQTTPHIKDWHAAHCQGMPPELLQLLPLEVPPAAGLP
jgi:hypothetical protein